MAHSDNNALSSAFKTFFERETLTGPNFNEWHRSLRIVLRVSLILIDYLYNALSDLHPLRLQNSVKEKGAWKAEYKKHSDVAFLEKDAYIMGFYDIIEIDALRLIGKLKPEMRKKLMKKGILMLQLVRFYRMYAVRCTRGRCGVCSINLVRRFLTESGVAPLDDTTVSDELSSLIVNGVAVRLESNVADYNCDACDTIWSTWQRQMLQWKQFGLGSYHISHERGVRKAQDICCGHINMFEIYDQSGEIKLIKVNTDKNLVMLLLKAFT
ncbi:hypothetical protein Tco_0467932 [Tanacetum coccineum]